MNRAFIEAVSYYLPPRNVSNEELAREFPAWNPTRAELITGIKNRRVEAADVPASEMAWRAAEKIFERDIKNIKKADKRDVDFLIVVTQSADYRLPCTACLLQAKLGLADSTGALDINLGCSGFVYGLILAKSLAASGAARKILLVAVEKSSFMVHQSDVTLRYILGDAAAAALISSGSGFAEIGESDYGTDGAGWRHILIPAGGSAMPCGESTKAPTADADGNLKYPEYERMNGMEIFNFSVKRGPASIRSALEKNNLQREQVDYFLLHQANKIIIDAIAGALKINPERIPVNISEVGNTSSCSIPILLSDLRDDGKLSAGKKLVLCGFGVGLSWASTALTIV
ncbi:MAG: ketoacyl-ACP synthase III [Synergistaceae bacterium]|nr:ketoacyl-ACP synthase III [Synergistaceae bacterium]